MYERCLDEDAHDSLNNLILKTTAALAESCMENWIKGIIKVFIANKTGSV